MSREFTTKTWQSSKNDSTKTSEVSSSSNLVVLAEVTHVSTVDSLLLHNLYKVNIEALIKKDKKESSKSTLKLRKEKKEKVFGAIAATADHFEKLRPLFARISQVGFRIFRILWLL